MTSLRLIAADPDSLFRAGIRSVFAQVGEADDPTLKLIDVVGTHHELIAQVRDHRPDIILMELDLPDTSDSTYPRPFRFQKTIAAIRQIDPRILIFILTQYQSRVLIQYLAEVVKVDWIFLKVDLHNPADLVRAVSSAYHALTYPLRNTYEIKIPRSPDILTSAEENLLVHISLHPDESIKQIAAGLDRGIGTINTQLVSIYKKLGTNKRTETLLRAIRLGILPARLVVDLPDSLLLSTTS